MENFWTSLQIFQIMQIHVDLNYLFPDLQNFKMIDDRVSWLKPDSIQILQNCFILLSFCNLEGNSGLCKPGITD